MTSSEVSFRPSICIDTEESSSAAAMDTALNYEREAVWLHAFRRTPVEFELARWQDRCNKAVVCSTQLVGHPMRSRLSFKTCKFINVGKKNCKEVDRYNL